MTSTEMLEYEFNQLRVSVENWRSLRAEEENLRGRIAAVEVQLKAAPAVAQRTSPTASGRWVQSDEQAG